MTRYLSRPRAIVAAGALAVGLLSGCSGSTGGSTTPDKSSTSAPTEPSGAGTASSATSGATSAPTASPTAAAHVQGKLTKVPARCPSPDDLTRTLGVSFHHVYPSSFGSGSLNCEYFRDKSPNTPVLNMLFARLGGTVTEWKQQVKQASPSAMFVPGIGEGAFYFTRYGAAPSGFNFVSGPVRCNMYTGNFKADQKHFFALAESILEG